MSLFCIALECQVAELENVARSSSAGWCLVRHLRTNSEVSALNTRPATRGTSGTSTAICKKKINKFGAGQKRSARKHAAANGTTAAVPRTQLCITNVRTGSPINLLVYRGHNITSIITLGIADPHATP